MRDIGGWILVWEGIREKYMLTLQWNKMVFCSLLLKWIKTVVLVFVVVAVQAQNRIEEGLKFLYNNYPQEKVVLSLSSEELVAGETLFFKAYVLIGYEPSDISSNVYVELYDRNKKLLDKTLLPIYKGSGMGSFTLPAQLKEDVYFIRAYTRWMLNYPEEWNYLRQIKIYNPASDERLEKKDAWTAAASPEGGHLVAGIPSKIAVRLFSLGSTVATWKAVLFEQGSNTPIATASRLNDELAVLNFTPKSSKYFVRLEDGKGKQKDLDLPTVSENGLALRVTHQGNLISYELSMKDPVKTLNHYRIIATINDQLVYSAFINKKDLQAKNTLDVTTLPAGVIRLTVFDEEDKAVAERLCFIKPKLEVIEPRLVFDSLSFQSRGLNQWQLEMDSLSWPNYSVQVEDADKPSGNHFLGILYLSSDFPELAGHEDGYFTDTQGEALDALLITERWRRFSWDELLNRQFPKINYQPDHGISFLATVKRFNKVQADKEVNLIFRYGKSAPQFALYKTDSTGRFLLPGLSLFDSLKVYYQQNEKKGTARDIDIQFESLNQFYPLSSPLPETDYVLIKRTASDTLSRSIAAALQNLAEYKKEMGKYKTMQEIVIRTKAKKTLDDLDKKLTSGFFSSTDAIYFDLINENQEAAAYPNILEWLQGRVPGLSIYHDESGQPYPYMRGGIPAIYIDEFRVDSSVVGNLPVSDIAMIKVFRGVFYGYDGATNGAVAIYTKKAGMSVGTLAGGLPTNILTGYKRPAHFRSPNYSDDPDREMRDYRTILYRNDLLVPDKSGSSALLKFYNSDITKHYRINICGFNTDGIPVYLEVIVK
jgi:hypothetical protein